MKIEGWILKFGTQTMLRAGGNQSAEIQALRDFLRYRGINGRDFYQSLLGNEEVLAKFINDINTAHIKFGAPIIDRDRLVEALDTIEFLK